MRARTASPSTTRVSMATPASAWASRAASTTARPRSGRLAAVRIVREAPVDAATCTARATALAAVADPSVPTRIRSYDMPGDATPRQTSHDHPGRTTRTSHPGGRLVTGSRRLAGRRARSGLAGLGELHGRRLEALDGPEGELLLAGLRVVLHVHDDDLAGVELLVEELLGERVLDEALDGPAQRAGAERGVVALVGDEGLRGRQELEPDALALELLLGASDHQVDDLGDLVLAQLVEDDRLVDPVQELGPEVLLERLVDLLLHLFVRDRLVGPTEAQARLAQVGRAEVRGHDQHGVAEVDRAALGVGEA